MKFFKNLSKTFEHYGFCSLCKGRAKPNINSRFENYTVSNESYHETISFTAIGGADTYYIDTVDNSFSIETTILDVNQSHYVGSLTSPWYKQYVAKSIESLTISCTKCQQYQIGIGLTANLRNKTIEDIHANFEKINVKVGEVGEMFEITNSYTTQKTKFVRHTPIIGKSKLEVFPIMADDMSDSAALVQRIQTLIPFL